MTDEEYERIKEGEKERLRAQKRLRSALESLKRRNDVQKVVRRMSEGAQRLLRKTGELADELASQAARQAARLEVATDTEEKEEALDQAEEILREKRAQEVVDRMKSQEEPRMSGQTRRSTTRSEEAPASPSEDEQPTEGPDKTIGRMGDVRSDDSN